MQRKFSKKLCSLILSMMLIVAMAFCATGCGNKNKTVGTGDKEFTFTVVDAEGKETVFEVKTDKTTVGEALVEEGLIVGEESEYGLYVKTVNGITVDYDTDGKYWAFYVNDEYATSGVDSTDIVEGDSYAFKVE
ncbi:MAG: DUF4430 domain-containing protein [Agathobacter sp.]|nr:DUF4430 domain-containing protein [Agathobacter sp.]